MGIVSRKERLFAYIIDASILFFINEGISTLGSNLPAQGLWITSFGIMGLAIPLIYYIWPYSTTGQTLGKRILKIKVISIDGSPLNIRKGIVRTVGFYLFGCLGLIWPFRDKNNLA